MIVIFPLLYQAQRRHFRDDIKTLEILCVGCGFNLQRHDNYTLKLQAKAHKNMCNGVSNIGIRPSM